MRPCLRFTLSSLAFGFVTLSFPTPALAGTITAGLYNLYDASVAGYSVTGTVTLDASGIATTANLTFNDPNVINTVLPNFTAVTASSAYNGLSQSYISGAGLGTGQIALFFNTAANANGLFGLCLNGSQCGTSATASSALQIYGFYNGVSNPGFSATNFSSGYLTSTSAATSAVAVTAEPAALLLLGTSLFGVPFLLQRRFHFASGGS